MARKRRRTNRNPRDHGKRRKPSENQNGANVSESTKITDINMDCMEHILKDLSLDDLLSVADCCSRLREAAVFTLVAKQTFKRLHLKDIRTTADQTIVYDHQGISIDNLTMALRFLRCFGHTIYKLTIDYSGIGDTHSAIVDQYITKYCSETLLRLEVSHARKQMMNHIQKPFSNVNFLQFSNCVLGEPLYDIAKWFPYLIELTFCGSNQIAAHNSIPSNFQSLSTFKVTLKNHHKSHFRAYVINLLRQHSFLKRLAISGDGWNAKFLQNVSKHLQNVHTLDIRWTNKLSNLNGGGKSPRPIHFKRVTELSIDFRDLENQLEMPRIPFSFDRLESITIYSMRSKINEDLLDFLGKQAFLKSFWAYFMNFTETIVDKMKLATALSRLHVIYLPCIFSCDEAKYFSSQCKSLQSFNFKCAETENIELLRENLANNNWEINIWGRLIEMKKRSQ